MIEVNETLFFILFTYTILTGSMIILGIIVGPYCSDNCLNRKCRRKSIFSKDEPFCSHCGECNKEHTK